jgi:uncharacterized membrane protein YphA (DoxX/SURF4 family)
MIDRVGGGLKDYAPFMLRLGLAVIFIGSGSRNLAHLGSAPETSEIVVAAVGILGGLFCLIGFLTRWAALALAVLMVWVLWQQSDFQAFIDWKRQISFATLVMSSALYGLGGGKWSIDEGKKKKE